MKLLSHGPEPCASANSAISAYLIFASKKRDFASSPTWCNLNHAQCVPLEIQSYRVVLKHFLVLLVSNLAFARFICRRQRSQRDQFRHTCVFSHIFTRLRVPRRSISLHPQALLYQMPLRMSILRSRIFRSSHKCRSTGEITESLCLLACTGSSQKKKTDAEGIPRTITKLLHASESVPLNGSRAVWFILCKIRFRYASAVAFDHAQRVDGAVARADLNVHMRLILVFAWDPRHSADRIARAELLTLLHRQL